MQINKICIFYHVSLEGMATFSIHFLNTKTGRFRSIFLYNIERLLDDMISKGFREADLFKNRMSTNVQTFTVEYYKEK